MAYSEFGKIVHLTHDNYGLSKRNRFLIDLTDFESNFYLQNRMKCRIIVKYILINTLINNFAFCNQHDAITTWQKLRSMCNFRGFINFLSEIANIKGVSIRRILINRPKTRVLSFKSDFSEINFSKISFAT